MSRSTSKKPLCPECGQPVTSAGKGRARVFCSEAHKQAHANRCAARGKALIKAAMAWRVNRGSGDVAKFAMAEMCAMLDRFAEEDRLAGRMRADDYFAHVTDFQFQNPIWSGKYMDRMNAGARKRATMVTCTRGFQGCEGTAPAGTEGWQASPATCPNCRDDNALVARAAE